MTGCLAATLEFGSLSTLTFEYREMKLLSFTTSLAVIAAILVRTVRLGYILVKDGPLIARE